MPSESTVHLGKQRVACKICTPDFQMVQPARSQARRATRPLVENGHNVARRATIYDLGPLHASADRHVIHATRKTTGASRKAASQPCTQCRQRKAEFQPRAVCD